MASEIVEFLLRVKDEASSSLRSVRGEAEGADKATASMAASSVAASSTMAGLATAAGSVAAVFAAVGTAMFKVADAASVLVDEYAILAAQTGMTAQEVVGLDKAARAAGLGGAQDLQQGLSALTRVLNEANRGSESAADRLAAIGLSAEQLNLATPNEQLRMVADGLAGLDSEGAKASAAIDLFGSRGARLVAVLGEGSGALDEWAGKAEAAGLIIGGDALEASAAMDAAMTDLNIAVEAVTVQVGTAFIPLFVKLGESLARNTPLLVNIARILAVDFASGVIFAGSLLQEFASVAIERVGIVTDAFGSLIDVLTTLDQVLLAVAQGDFSAAAAAAGQLKARFGELTDNAAEAADVLLNPGRALDEFGGAARRAGQTALAFRNELTATKDAATDAAGAIGGNRPDSIKGAAEATTEAVNETAEALSGLAGAGGDLQAIQSGLTSIVGGGIRTAGRAAGSVASGDIGGAIAAAAPAIGSAMGGPVGAAVGQAVGALISSLQSIGASITAAQDQRADINSQIAEAQAAAASAQTPEERAAAEAQIEALREQRSAIKGGAELMGAKIEEGIENLLAGILALPELIAVRIPEAIFGVLESIGDIVSNAVTSLLESRVSLFANLDEIAVNIVMGIVESRDEIIAALFLLVPRLIKEIVGLPFRILVGLGKALGQWWSDIGGFAGIARAIAEGVGEWFAKAWADIKAWFKDLFTIGGEDRDNDGKTGLSETGGFFRDVGEFIASGDTQRDHYPKGGFVTRDGMAFVEAGERIVRTNGEESGTGRAMGTQGGGGGGVNVYINGLVDSNILDRMVRELERRYGATGNRTSDLFATG